MTRRAWIVWFALIASFVPGFDAFSFPRGQCFDKKCGSSPYALTWVEASEGEDQARYCFRLSTRPCTNSEYDCCNIFQESLKKFVIHVRADCESSFKGVTVNGVAKRGGVFYDIYEGNNAELRVTNLAGIDMATANDTTVCIHLAKPCYPLENFCILKNGLCYSSVWDVERHECCPRCVIQDAIESSDPPSPSPLPSPEPSPDPSPEPSPEPSPTQAPRFPADLKCKCRCRHVTDTP
jgi:hypothetical protein